MVICIMNQLDSVWTTILGYEPIYKTRMWCFFNVFSPSAYLCVCRFCTHRGFAWVFRVVQVYWRLGAPPQWGGVFATQHSGRFTTCNKNIRQQSKSWEMKEADINNLTLKVQVRTPLASQRIFTHFCHDEVDVRF